MNTELILEWEQDTKRARVMQRDGEFEVDFFENEKPMGTINYAQKSLRYVEDAAENWVTGVMTHDTLSFYKKD